MTDTPPPNEEIDAINALQKTGDLEQDGEELIFNPYNPENVEITEEDVCSILSKFGLPPRIHNFQLYRRAFIHRSYTKRPELENELLNVKLAERPDDCMKLSTKSNERLEFLGDGVLELVVKYYLYRRFPKEDEGFMTEKKIALVKNEHIGKLSLSLGLHKWFIISRHAEERNTRTNLKKLGCLFEAFIGAIFLDNNKYNLDSEANVFSQLVDEEDMYISGSFITGHGFNYAQKFVEAVMEREVDWTRLISYDDNFKNQLQVKIQKVFKTTPHYLQTNIDEETGEITMAVCLCLNQQIYETNMDIAVPFANFGSFEKILEVSNDGKPILVWLGSGIHKIKKKAEQKACADALTNIA
jgi:dsRNA-specific ribonuclease